MSDLNFQVQQTAGAVGNLAAAYEAARADVERLARERDEAIGGEQRLQELLDRAYDERDEARADFRSVDAFLLKYLGRPDDDESNNARQYVLKERPGLEAEVRRLRAKLRWIADNAGKVDFDVIHIEARSALENCQPHQADGPT